MKVLVILLIVGVLLFVVLMVWGSGKNSQKPVPPKDAAENFNRDRDNGKHSNLDAFNGILGPFGPTLKASSLTPALTAFDLGAKTSYTITIRPDDKHKFRQAKFLVEPTQPVLCAQVVYKAIASKDVDENLRNQDSNAVKNKKPPNEFTLTILEAGGTLTVGRNPNFLSPNTGPCKVELK